MSGGAWSKFRRLKIENCVKELPVQKTAARPDPRFDRTCLRQTG